MSVKTIKRYEDLPLEANKTYQTRIDPNWYFKVNKDPYDRDKDGNIIRAHDTIWGEYTNCKFLSDVPIPRDRLVPERVLVGEVEACGKCGNIIKDDIVVFDRVEKRYKRVL